MARCNDPEEPECEGFTCPKWGKCAYSKDVMAEDPNVLENNKRRNKTMPDNPKEIVRSSEELSVKGDSLFFCDCALWQHRIYLFVGRNLAMGVYLRKLTYSQR